MKKEIIEEYAYSKVPFYQELLQENDCLNYPIINKELLLEKRDKFFSTNCIGDLYAGKLESVMTSGSTGECLEIFWKKEDNIRSLLPLWIKRKRYYDILPSDKYVYFFTTCIEKGNVLEYKEVKNGLGINKIGLTQERILDIYKRIQEYSPKWIIIQPSVLAIFLKTIKQYKLNNLPSLKYIEVTGELLMDSVRKEIIDFFQCPVASQYGCYEVNSIAYECPCHNMHIMEENVDVEIVDGNNICVTSLHNSVMPFIRYKVGDRGEIRNQIKCKCGDKSPILVLQKARDNDLIYYKNGTAEHSDIFYHIIEKINIYLQQVILQFQIIQEKYDDFWIYLTIDDLQDREEVQELFLSMAKKYNKKWICYIIFVDSLYPCEKTGKLAWFVSKVKGDKNED